jgi:hypothetical protein
VQRGKHSQQNPLPHEWRFFTHRRFLSSQMTSSPSPSIAEITNTTNH